MLLDGDVLSIFILVKSEDCFVLAMIRFAASGIDSAYASPTFPLGLHIAWQHPAFW